jgi:hypothetical protein
MELKPYLLSMPMPERTAFSARCGTTWNHLRNIAYGQKPCADELAVSIEKESGGSVTVSEINPEFAELLAATGYVKVGAGETPCAIQQEAV